MAAFETALVATYFCQHVSNAFLFNSKQETVGAFASFKCLYFVFHFEKFHF